MATPRWKQRPPGSNWGDFGPDDQLGRLNLLTPQKVLEGVAEVRTGLRFCLSLPLDLPGGNVINPRRFPPVLTPVTRHDGRSGMNYPFRFFDRSCTDVVSDDYVTLYLQYSTQWDSFAHDGQLFDANGDGIPEAVYYNGFRAGQDIVGPVYGADDALVSDGEPGRGPPGGEGQRKPGAWKLGADNYAKAAIQGRGVLIDIEAHFGRVQRHVSYDDIALIMERDGITVEPGDMVLFRTGYAQSVMEMGGHPDRKRLAAHAELDGSDQRILNWITDRGIAAMIADNYTLEKNKKTGPFPMCCSMIPIHELCLFKLGIPIGELWYLSELADWLRANKRSRFLLTAPALRLPGAAGSPLTPVATV